MLCMILSWEVNKAVMIHSQNDTNLWDGKIDRQEVLRKALVDLTKINETYNLNYCKTKLKKKMYDDSFSHQ